MNTIDPGAVTSEDKIISLWNARFKKVIHGLFRLNGLGLMKNTVFVLETFYLQKQADWII